MIFSVLTDPARRGEGLATRVLERGRAELVLTCEDELVGFTRVSASSTRT